MIQHCPVAAVEVSVQQMSYEVQEPAGQVIACAVLSGAILARSVSVSVSTLEGTAQGTVVS